MNNSAGAQTAREPFVLAPPESVERAAIWLAEAVEWARARGATDLHFFPGEDEAVLWARVDGELREAARYSSSIHVRLIARLKILGRCTDYDGQLVQEGRFSLNGRSEDGEARLSIIPVLRGEKAVVRLMSGGKRLRKLEELGFPNEMTDALRAACQRPHGLMLVIGPSGCGKSTTLYALLHDLFERAGRPLSIVTIEDPVEQSLACAAQVTADPARGLGFAAGLRAILRQDPEVIMIGEIRDAETASVGLHAALTGHRLLSSMHTLSPAEALVRLQQMGCEPYVIASALAGTLNQRLVRLVCPQCRRLRPLKPEELALIPEAATWPERVAAQGVGCGACLGSGHQGRTAIGEWVIPGAETPEALQARRPALEIARTLCFSVSARPAALSLVREGRAAPDQWGELTGLASLEKPQKEPTP
ncbi:MAG: ATPase, T2SS/T4P/T4SS family [Candidatus Sumerlaeota bacterium]|nr:ATPase, T2SS/T4P/T4SS family [Candidatus Sumerlaeota bacterium]